MQISGGRTFWAEGIVGEKALKRAYLDKEASGAKESCRR